MRTKSNKSMRGFGAKLREARAAREMTQRDLATRLAVGQQAVSNWERGVSRPLVAVVRKTADLFPEISPEAWMELAGYRVGRHSTSPGTLRPVRPLLETLPLDKLSFAQFQAFCSMLLRFRYKNEAEVNEFGIEGDKQYGIDIEVKFYDGRRYEVYQCKREEKFGKAKVERAIKALEIRCDRAVILLSRRATAGARSAIPKRSRKWSLWDSKDICRELKSLPLIAQRQVIDKYFPAYRKDFLGIEELTAVEDLDVYFAPFMRKESAFSHTWKLAGRDEERAKLGRLVERGIPRTSILAGSGGLGKSRLAYEVAQDFINRHSNHQVLVLAPGKPLAQADVDIIGERPALVIIEDAHDHQDIESILRLFTRNELRETRLLMICRPYALSLLQGAAIRAGYELDDDSTLTLLPIGVAASETIAMEIMRARNASEKLAKEIAVATRGSPLFLVVGAHLVATRKMLPSALNNAQEFQSTILRTFREVLAGDVGTEQDKNLVRDVLDLIALIQPLSIDSASIDVIANNVLNRPPDKVRRAIRVLSDAGVIVARGRMLRIMPDLLGEFILRDRCVMDANGRSTGFIESVLPHASERTLANVLVNSSRLDWRIHEGRVPDSRIADIAWDDLERRVVLGSSEWPSILEGVALAAYYQPRRALRFFDAVNPTEHARDSLARLLKHVAMNMEFLDAALQRLWMMGLEDRRRLNQFPEHAHRILAELAEIEPGKPIEFSERVVEVALQRLKPGIDSFELDRVLEVLEAALKPEGHTTSSKGFSLVMDRYSVRLAAVRTLRRRIIDTSLGLLRSSDLALAVKAVSTLAHALRAPMNLVPEVLQELDEDFAITLRQVRDILLSDDLHSVVIVQILKAVHWHAEFGSGRSRTVAIEVQQAVDESIGFLCILGMVDSWGETRRQRGESVLEDWHREQKEIARKLVDAFTAPEELVDFLAEQLEAIQTARIGSSPGTLVGLVTQLDLRIATLICGRALVERNSPLRGVFGDAMVALAAEKPDAAMEFAREGLAQQDDGLTLHIVWGYGWRLRSLDDGSEEELQLVAGLIPHENVNVAVGAIRAVGSCYSRAPAKCFQAFLTADFSRSREIAEAVFAELAQKRKLAQVALSGEMIRNLLDALVHANEIDGYWTGQFLSLVRSKYPGLFVEFAMERINREVSLGERRGSYHALPFLWGEESESAQAEDQMDPGWLKRVREWFLESTRCHPFTFWGPKLYHAIRGSREETVVDDLSEWIQSRDAEKFSIMADLMQSVPREFIFNQPRFAAQLLDNAYDVSTECGKDMEGSLWAAAMMGSRQGRPGEPFPEDIFLKDRSTALMETFPQGSHAYRLFQSVNRSAQANIMQKQVEDEELFEE